MFTTTTTTTTRLLLRSKPPVCVFTRSMCENLNLKKRCRPSRDSRRLDVNRRFAAVTEPIRWQEVLFDSLALTQICKYCSTRLDTTSPFFFFFFCFNSFQHFFPRNSTTTAMTHAYLPKRVVTPTRPSPSSRNFFSNPRKKYRIRHDPEKSSTRANLDVRGSNPVSRLPK